MTKNTNFFNLETREDGQLVNVTVWSPTHVVKGQEIVIGSQNSMDIADAQSVLRAASDLMKFAIYASPLTTLGLHVYSKYHSLNGLFRASNLGVIHTSYAGDLPIPVPSQAEYPEGWAQVNLRNGRFILSKFNPDYSALRSRKHDYVEALLMGYTITVRVLPFNSKKGESGLGYADTIVKTWQEQDMEKANKMRIDGFNAYQLRQELYAPVRKALAASNGVMPVLTPQETNVAVILNMKDGTQVNLATLGFCNLKITEKNKATAIVNWDGSWRARRQLQVVASKPGMKVEVL